MDSQNMSNNAGQAKGQAQTRFFVLLQEKANTVMDKASNAAQSAQESLQEVGQQMQAKAQGAADAVKNATGMNK
uniref:Stress-induced protein KIN2-like n=2 Tax=Glycine subgen. Soja TaxID=1462606 RepID=A0A0R0GVC3_SOYBN